MKALHVSAECYPAAKEGGMGDVVGALPKYLNSIGCETAVILPKYATKWIHGQSFKGVYQGTVHLHYRPYDFQIELLENEELGFPLFVVNVPGLLDRPGIYADEQGRTYGDELERFICFQRAVLQWINQLENKPEVIHCHDHHSGLIPFMMQYCYDFKNLRKIPTVFTIHNGEYHGAFGWNMVSLLPMFDSVHSGILDWNKTINPLAAAIKCCWKLTTVSPGYLDELHQQSNGLEWLISNESAKSAGILNGIDTEVWNPKKDPLIFKHLSRSIKTYKAANKQVLVDHFQLQPDLPIFTFIGRLVREKGADLLPDLIFQFLNSGFRASFVILGTGDQGLEASFHRMNHSFKPYFRASLEYNETLAHQLYAGSDYLLMPSRVEPCGLNQLYALRYGTVPIVRSVGGLKNTIIDLSEENGSGIRFDNFTLIDAFTALYRAKDLYENTTAFENLRQRIMALDFSWERSAREYKNIYDHLTN